MRALASRLQVTPMAIYHHFGDRAGLIDAMSEHVYAAITAPVSGMPDERIKALLLAYHDKVLQHPGLTLLIFSQPEVFPRQARRITADIAQLLAETGLSPERSRLWLHILVDFTHGAAIAAAMASRSKSAVSAAKDDFDKALVELLKELGSAT